MSMTTVPKPQLENWHVTVSDQHNLFEWTGFATSEIEAISSAAKASGWYGTACASMTNVPLKED